jgi:8-oxo-dGTP pyrophosphatase MutT (NUDIX family)
MGYVDELRKKVGCMPCVIAYAVMVVLNDKNQLLLEERADDGMWDVPGGSVEFNEKVDDAACRELKEETNLTATSYDFLAVYSGPLTYYKYWNGHEVSGVDVVYCCRKYVGEMKPQPEEVKRLVYFDIDKVPDKMNPRNKQIVKDLKAKYHI